jgi:hypothetical protein
VVVVVTTKTLTFIDVIVVSTTVVAMWSYFLNFITIVFLVSRLKEQVKMYKLRFVPIDKENEQLNFENWYVNKVSQRL